MRSESRFTGDARVLDARVLVGTAGVVVLLLAVGFFALESSRAVGRSSRAILDENVGSLRAVAELELALLDQKGMVANYLLAGEEEWLRELEAKRARSREWFARARRAAFSPEEAPILDRIERLYEEYDLLRAEVIALARQGNPEEARRLQLEKMGARIEELHRACEELLAVNERLMLRSQWENERLLAWLRAGVLAGVGAAILLGAIGGWVLARRLTRRLVRSEKFAALGQMAGFLAHEVRNPLTAIGMRIDALRGEFLSSSAREDVEVIGREIRRLDCAVRTFLDLAKPAAGGGRVALGEVVAEAIDVLRPLLAARGVAVVTRFDGGVPAVRADGDQMKQVFLNLFRNAAEAMPNGGTLTIEARRDGKGEAEIRVTDTGPGVPRRRRERVFEPFFTTKAEGTGLGLSTARLIVERHGGSIEFEPEGALGARVAVRLPAREGSEG